MAESGKRSAGRAGRNTLRVPRDLQLPPTKRDQPAFREQRKQKLKEYLLIRKTMFSNKQENQISREQKVMISEDQAQEQKKVLKLKTEMADKENIRNMIEKNGIPLKADEATSSEIHNLKDNTQAVQLLSTRDDFKGQTVTAEKACHLKDNKKMQATAEKPKQDDNIPKKRVLGYYHGQVVQSKINSFRKVPNIKGESPSATKKLPPTVSKATKAKSAPVNAVSIRASSVTATTKFVNTKSVSTTSKNTLVRPPIRSLHNNTIRKAPLGKELQRSELAVTFVNTRPSQDTKRDKAPSRSKTSESVSRTHLSNTRLIEKSENMDRRRYTMAGATVPRSVQPKETTEERKAPMTERRTGKGKGLKRPPNLIANQSETKGQKENPVGSFWTTMAEEDEQRLFTEKVNKTISECLNLINKKGCPKEEILDTLNDLIHNIPDAKKLVKYWICLVRIEPVTSPIENIISIYEKAILAGAQPIEEMRHIIIDILTMKSQEKVNLGENIEEGHATKGHTQEVKTEETSVNIEPGNSGEEHEDQRNVKVCENNQDKETKEPARDFITPDSKTEAGCLIRYNVSSTPCLQSMKKKMQHGNNSTVKELKFLTPVRRSRRIQEKTLQLPDMLKDHDPCVSSLGQLSELGEDAFVCRPNTALCPLFSETDTVGEK
ncbi:cytoskeleton-associated protein 2 isoform X1 [Cricetulus griseus]|uniref:Cytoskeleton-associated protein 2 n=2 Tax=Cricetulus griseus TaxID=10029 RepID=G3HHJ3_CRIGR|nr:cytoskeleton-associated protein 2 isoform X1 [Cricetulus griseus]EGV95009.1 Cytoskeleton-associated protein 2 [Cricetulus griseus]